MPDATVVIVTRNRCAELRGALASATAQRGSVEVMVLDDGSDDETRVMVARDFPEVRLLRYETRAGLVVRRNQAAALARAPVLVSIDDDATFTAVDCVQQTLRDFDDPRVAAVAMPYDEVIDSYTARCQRAPSTTAIWVTPTFRGTAYAIRRDLFLDLHGFRDEIVHQGEEDDLCLRLLAAGYVVRLGRAAPILHRPSATRDLDRMDTYGRRNELLTSYTFFPAPLAAARMTGYAAKGLLHGVRVRRPMAMVRGIAHGLAAVWRLRHERQPLPWAVARLDRRLRRRGPLRLEEVAAWLPSRATA